MKIFIKLTSILLISVFLSLQLEGNNKEAIDPEFVQFWKEFQTAVKSGDKEKVVGVCNFPLFTGSADEGCYISYASSKEEFLERYEYCFSKPNKKRIFKTKADEFRLEIIDYTFDDRSSQIECYYKCLISYEMAEGCAQAFGIKKIDGVYKIVIICN